MFDIATGAAPAETPSSTTVDVAKAPQKEEKDSIPEIRPAESPSMGSFGALILFATIITIVGTVMLYLMSLSKESNIRNQTTQFDSLKQELASGELAKLDRDLQEIMAGETALDQALNSRIYWSKFWAELNRVTPKAVAYNSMSVDDTGAVLVSGTAADFSSVAKLMVSLQQAPVFSEVQLGNTSLKEQGGKSESIFSVKLKVNAGLLK